LINFFAEVAETVSALNFFLGAYPELSAAAVAEVTFNSVHF
jgi:hypothetical protein